ncbi:MAG: CRISPR-associated endonuclease Cas2 [Candidatus Binatia bacterium]
MFTVIAFDIVDDRIRYRTVQALREYSVRVQKSVFEAAMLSPTNFQRLRQDVEQIIDLRLDHVRYYFLCRSCRDRLQISGTGSVTVEEEYKVL